MDDDVDAVLDTVCRGAVRLLNAAPGITRVHVRSGEASVELERGVAAPADGTPVGAAAAPAEPATDEAEPGQPPAGEQVRAPMVGTFYRAPGPGEPPYVSVGDVLGPGQQIGILEAMKLMNPVESTARGRVAEILVPDGAPVEYDQPLLRLVSVEE